MSPWPKWWTKIELCVHACVCAGAHPRVHACVRVCTYVHACLFAGMHARTHACVCACACVCMRVCARACVCAFACVRLRAYVRACKHCRCVCQHLCASADMSVHLFLVVLKISWLVQYQWYWCSSTGGPHGMWCLQHSKGYVFVFYGRPKTSLSRVRSVGMSRSEANRRFQFGMRYI